MNEALLDSIQQITPMRQRSEMTQEILSRKPGPLEKFGLFAFIFVLLLLLAGTWFIRYPDTISAKATLTASCAPKEIITRQQGALTKLLIHNNEIVKRGQIIGWIESAADHQEVLMLSAQIDSSVSLFMTNHVLLIPQRFSHYYDRLGELQQPYQTFITAILQFNDYKVNGFYDKRRDLLENDVISLNNSSLAIRQQQTLTDEDARLAAETFKMNKLLSDEKVLSSDEFRTENSKFLRMQMNIPQLQASLISNEIQLREKHREILQLSHDMSQQEIIFQQALFSLKSAVDEWKLKYILQAPIDGKVFFTIAVQENQFLKQGMLLGYIMPENNQFYMQAYLPQENFGKADTGLQVQLRFDAYPYQELGYVSGRVQYISNVAVDSGFLANVSLDEGLITNNHKIISYKNGLKAEAIIITKNRRLSERIWASINKSLTVVGHN